MKDIPIFDTQYGIASLLLKEIPYRQIAYIRVRSVLPGSIRELLEECAAFCRMAGAEHIYASGHEDLKEYPLHVSVIRMQGAAQIQREKIRNLFPVTEKTVEHWRSIYNGAMRHVDNAATLEQPDEAKILLGGAYFVHDNGTLLGIGWLEEEKLLAIAAVQPGAGETVAHTLLSVIEGATVSLEVASTNAKAIRLYEKLGFVPVEEVNRWYRV